MKLYIVVIPCSLLLLAICKGQEKPQPATAANWVNISDSVTSQLKEQNKKIDWPGLTAGATVDPTNGDVYMIVPGQGIWKSTDRGGAFARADGGKIGGRCETGYALNFDPAGKRLACFMLDGPAGITLDSGKTWRSFKNVGRNWDYAAVDWSQSDPKSIFAARHESGGEMYLSADGGQSWKQIGKDPKFAGVGIFDDKTLLTTKGGGILRSTDAGSTWAKVSDLQPIGRVVQVYKNVAWWLGKEGLLVSTDKGATWSTQGKPVDASFGPWFASKKHLMVAGKKGFFQTTDGGQSWILIAPIPAGFDVPMPGWFTNPAWDPIHDVLYASKMGMPTYKLERQK
ncbi:MAG TPA: hypothetical protein VFC78_04505 [Tepidisphaeraceae bacterium]|nr:hypothetical protein [Tepidisphaeraceae bacterium]